MGNSFVSIGTNYTTIPIFISGYTTNTTSYNNYIISYLAQLDNNLNFSSISTVKTNISTNEGYISAIAAGLNQSKQEKIAYLGTT